MNISEFQYIVRQMTKMFQQKETAMSQWTKTVWNCFVDYGLFF